MERPSSKLEARLIGPYWILSFNGKIAAKLGLPSTIYTSPIVHISRIEPAVPTLIPFQTVDKTSIPVLVNGKEEFVVERIVDSRRRRNRLEFKVEWQGYTDSDQFQWLLWEEVQDLAALDEFSTRTSTLINWAAHKSAKERGRDGRKQLRRVRGASFSLRQGRIVAVQDDC